MDFVSDEDIVQRWAVVADEFVKLTNEVSPKLLKLSKLERELVLLKEEILKRGITIEAQNDR